MAAKLYSVALKKGASKSDILEALSRNTGADNSANTDNIPDRAIEQSDEQRRDWNPRIFEI